jgi:thioredoxin reductase (NADPH)
MTRPVLLVLDGDSGVLQDVERELDDRYGRHYRVVCRSSAEEARAILAELAAADEPVALILAGERFAVAHGLDLLNDARALHPQARRVLLIEWKALGDRPTARIISDAISHGWADYYLVRPAKSPDEVFHSEVSNLLLDWAESRMTFPFTVHVVGETWSGRAYELREALGRCAMPHTFTLADSTLGQELVAVAGPDARLPIMVLPNGDILQDPSNAEISVAVGGPVAPGDDDYDLIIVGAGPAGLSAAVYGASEGLRTLVVDEGGIGGQATTSSLIRNYLGFPRGIGGRRLAQRAYEQAWLFGASFALMQRVSDLRSEPDGLSVAVSDFGRVRAPAVVLATGARYRRLGVPTLEALNGAGVYYGGSTAEGPALAGRDVYVVGGANSSGQAALHLARFARQVTVVIRRESLALSMSHYLVQQIEATPNIAVRARTEVVGGGGIGWLDHLVLRDHTTGCDETVPAAGLAIMIGADPGTDWLPDELCRDEAGFVLTGADIGPNPGWPHERSPFLLETSMPGVFAVGDVRHGAGRRVAASVGEGAVAVQLLHRYLAERPSRPVASSPPVTMPPADTVGGSPQRAAVPHDRAGSQRTT